MLNFVVYILCLPVSSTENYRIHDDLLHLFLVTNGLDESISELITDYVTAALDSIRLANNGTRFYATVEKQTMTATTCSLGTSFR